MWEKKKMDENIYKKKSIKNSKMEMNKGRWDKRMEEGGIKVKQVYESERIIKVKMGKERRMD